MQLDRCQRPQKELLFERISNTFSCTHRHSKIMQIPTSVPTEYSLLLLETKTNPNVWPVFTRDASNSIHFLVFSMQTMANLHRRQSARNINPVISNRFFHHFCTLCLSRPLLSLIHFTSNISKDEKFYETANETDLKVIPNLLAAIIRLQEYYVIHSWFGVSSINASLSQIRQFSFLFVAYGDFRIWSDGTIFTLCDSDLDFVSHRILLIISNGRLP